MDRGSYGSIFLVIDSRSKKRRALKLTEDADNLANEIRVIKRIRNVLKEG